MRRLLAIVLVLAAMEPLVASAGLPGPVPVPASLPPYTPPLSVLDDVLHLPPGEPVEVVDGRVSYGPAAHLRLTLALQLGPGLSDERARVAWLMGWRDAQAAQSGALDAEHRARLRAEAESQVASARLQALAGSIDWEWWRELVTGVGIAGLGVAAGFLIGVSK